MSAYIESAKGYSENTELNSHFLQPTLAVDAPLTDYELALIESMPLETKCGIDGLRTASLIYSRWYNEHAHRTNGVDLSRLFWPRVDEREYFFDWIHVASPANMLIAKHIFQEIRQNLD